MRELTVRARRIWERFSPGQDAQLYVRPVRPDAAVTRGSSLAKFDQATYLDFVLFVSFCQKSVSSRIKNALISSAHTT
jgi:hypothetical protein